MVVVVTVRSGEYTLGSSLDAGPTTISQSAQGAVARLARRCSHAGLAALRGLAPLAAEIRG